MLDVEFTKGTSVQFDLKQPMDIEDVRAAIKRVSDQRPVEFPSPNVVAVGSDKLAYEVTRGSFTTFIDAKTRVILYGVHAQPMAESTRMTVPGPGAPG